MCIGWGGIAVQNLAFGESTRLAVCFANSLHNTSTAADRDRRRRAPRHRRGRNSGVVNDQGARYGGSLAVAG